MGQHQIHHKSPIVTCAEAGGVVVVFAVVAPGVLRALVRPFLPLGEDGGGAEVLPSGEVVISSSQLGRILFLLLGD